MYPCSNCNAIPVFGNSLFIFMITVGNGANRGSFGDELLAFYKLVFDNCSFSVQGFRAEFRLKKPFRELFLWANYLRIINCSWVPLNYTMIFHSLSNLFLLISG